LNGKDLDVVITKDGTNTHVGNLNIEENGDLLFTEKGTQTPYIRFEKTSGSLQLGRK
jgi:hypothetical protein